MTEIVQVLLDRARVYSFLSAVFSDPSTEKFSRVWDPEMQSTLLEVCRRLEESRKGRIATRAAEKLTEAIGDTAPHEVNEEFIRIFGHTLSKEIAPYELEYLKNQEVFAVTQSLADINGFYAAFGLQVEAAERADHIAIESEFLSHVILKEAVAIENNLGEESIEVCRKAQHDFMREHFVWWAAGFAKGLIAHPSASFYLCAGGFLLEFLKTEHKLQL